MKNQNNERLLKNQKVKQSKTNPKENTRNNDWISLSLNRCDYKINQTS